jgi:hypothetical protein
MHHRLFINHRLGLSAMTYTVEGHERGLALQHPCEGNAGFSHLGLLPDEP